VRSQGGDGEGSNKLDMDNTIIQYTTDLGGYSLLVNRNNKNIIEYGDIHDTFNIASIRKCLLSALYGIQVDKGKIDLSTTLKELSVDDNPPSLSQEEQQATVEDLLKLRSGIYHNANYETASSKENRPERGSHAHNTFWYYNNWDANVLGTIYRSLLRTDIFQDFKILIADKIRMNDFKIENCEYKSPDENSIHPAYIFRMSTEDLLKFVLLYLNKGNWNGSQIIPRNWIDKSLETYSITPNGNGFGYMWETSIAGKLFGIEAGDGAFAYSGYPGHFIVGVPSRQLSIVYCHNIELPDKKFVPTEKFAELLQLILKI
jgi:CubicO group peptidase (beta-lactamase class C family)